MKGSKRGRKLVVLPHCGICRIVYRVWYRLGRAVRSPMLRREMMLSAIIVMADGVWRAILEADYIAGTWKTMAMLAAVVIGGVEE